MKRKTTDKWLFWLVVIYLPASILFVFWLYAASLLYPPGSPAWKLFYGEEGNSALLWLFAVLLPAVVFLVSGSRGRKTVARLSGAVGFYCLLGGLLSAHGFLALPGFVFLAVSVFANRWRGKTAPD